MDLEFKKLSGEECVQLLSYDFKKPKLREYIWQRYGTLNKKKIADMIDEKGYQYFFDNPIGKH